MSKNQLLKNLKQDFAASIVVFFVALPLCLGIALASGAPLFSGIIAGIVGGVVVGYFSGSQLGVSGPAAGLAVLVLGYIATLGGSFESFLLAVVICGLIQVIAGFLRLGNIAYYFPSSVIKGMLAGIGIIIIIKQIPHAIGYDAEFSNDFDFDSLDGKNSLSALEHMLGFVSVEAITIAAVSLFILLFWENFLAPKFKIFKAIPSALFAVICGIILSEKFQLEPNQIVNIPISNSATEFFANFTAPNFSEIFNPQIYLIALIMAVVASLETLLCVEATDKLDPQKRITPTNRELKAQGIGNIISGLIGGLPITQVVVRSSANIDFGAKSKLSTIFHGIFLLICVVSIPQILNKIPLATLSCILIVVGYKLTKPKIYRETFKMGGEQFWPFLATIAGMLVFDLLKGVGIGLTAAIFYLLYHNLKNSHEEVIEKEGSDNLIVIKLSEEVSFLNKGKIMQLIKNIPNNSRVLIDCTKSKAIHQDVIEILNDFRTNAKSRKIELEIRSPNKIKI